MAELKVGGFTPLSMSDYPGHLSAVIFCQGCPWRCRYCHNTHLIPNKNSGDISFNDILLFLNKRRGLLDAVVLSGGEPTMQNEIVDAAIGIKSLGFKVALHTCGQYPKVLEKLLPCLSWIGMDIKAPFHKYQSVVQRKVLPERILESIKLIINSKVAYEFRTTVHKDLLSKEDLFEIAGQLNEMGANEYILQEFRTEGCTDQELCSSYSDLAQYNKSKYRDLFKLRGFSNNL